MRALIDLLPILRFTGTGKSRPPRPSVLLRRRRQLLIAVVVTGFVLGLTAGTIWVRRAGFVEWAALQLKAAAGVALRDAGLTVRAVYVVGRERSPRQDILAALAVKRGDTMLDFDPAAARDRLLAIGWIKRAQVYRRLPDLIEVRLQERRPLALWQNEGRLALIGDDGATILRQGLERFADLPIVVGPKAPMHAAQLIGTLNIEPALFAQVEAVVRVGGRRWDVKLRNGVMVKLPEGDAKAGWVRLARLQAEHGLLDRSVEAIDMRLPDRLVVRLTPEAAAERRDPGKET